MDTVAEKKSDLLDQLTLVKTQYDAATLSLSQKQSQVGREDGELGWRVTP